MGALTVLTGVNSSGKSSVLQSLLLLRQSFKKGRLSFGLDLNAPLCDIGNGNDALYRFSETETINFSLEVNRVEQFDFNFNVKGKYEDTFLPHDKTMTLQPALMQLPLFSNSFQYISSSRWANMNLYPMDTYAVETERQISLNYGQGELVAHFLNCYGEHRDFEVKSDLLLHPCSSNKKLLKQVVAWEREISPRVGLKTVRKTDKVSIEYDYKGNGDNPPTQNLQSGNVGFGISYSLSVVVALLSAGQGDLLLIENPEAHLHPRGQSRLAELMALAAQSGIQLIIETHSDHIFNGICKAIAAKKVDGENVKVHYFELDDKNSSISTEIKISERGRILNHKKGFFDQFDDDLDELLGL
jgi:predicted ATPase